MPKSKKQKKSAADEALQSSASLDAMDESATEATEDASSYTPTDDDFPDDSEEEDSESAEGPEDSQPEQNAGKSKAKSKAETSGPSPKNQKSKVAKPKDDSREPPATRVLRAGEAPKLSARSSGPVGYEVGEDIETGEVKLRLTRNEGGTFSKEWVPLARIAEAVAEPDKAGRSFHATRLKETFAGRSTNNAPFLAAALVAEDVLLKSDEDGRKVMLRVARAPESWPDFLRWEKFKAKSPKEKIKETSPEAGFEANAGAKEDA
jgi:hypothetical protein